MKRLLVVLALGAALSGCQYGYHGSSWTPAPDATSYGTWTHEAAPDPQHCNEYDVEPASETDDFGNLCKTVLP